MVGQHETESTDLGFHPEWKKKYVNIIVQLIPFIFKEKNIQIMISTHDPLTLSDLPNNNIIYLEKTSKFSKALNYDDPARPSKTFGANITDLLAESFFVKGGLIGDFAKAKINETIRWINENKKQKSKNFGQEIIYHKKVILLIDEHITRIKLSEMISELEPDSKFQKSILEEEIKFLQKKANSLK